MQRKTGAKPDPTRRKPRPIAAAIASIALLAIMVACGGAATPILTATPELPTAPPSPTATAAPTATSAPAATPEPATVAVTIAAVAPTPTIAPAATPAPPAATATPEPAAPAETPAAAPTPQPTLTPAPTATAPAVTPTETATPAPTSAPPPPCAGDQGGQVGNCAPEFTGTQEWINSEPLSMANLRGQVVLIDFWTYSCINCLRTPALPARMASALRRRRAGNRRRPHPGIRVRETVR